MLYTTSNNSIHSIRSEALHSSHNVVWIRAFVGEVIIFLFLIWRSEKRIQ